MSIHAKGARLALATVLLVIFGLVACHESDPVNPARKTLTLEAVASSNNGEIDVDVEAHLLDSTGKPVAGSKLEFTASAGRFEGASEDTPTESRVATDGAGEARERLHLGLDEPKHVRIVVSDGSVSSSYVLAQEGAQAVIVATPSDSQITGEPVTFDGSNSTVEGEITAYRWTLTSDDPDPGSDPVEVVEAVDAVSIERTYQTPQSLTVKLEITDDPEAGEKIDAGEEVDYIAESTLEYEILPPNDPPVADAGEDIEQECSSPAGGTVTLDGSASSDPDSTPGTNDDIVAFDWFEDFGEATEAYLGEGEMLDYTFSLGQHVVTLRVTDSRGETDTDSVIVDIIDVTPPDGRITSPDDGACFGPDDVPVTVTDNYTDVCSEGINRSYDPGPGPGYSDHGDYDVTLTVTDGSGNSSSDSVSFTIDLEAPVVQIYRPYGVQYIDPTVFPISILFDASDNDGASGGVVHERVLIQDCVVLDGWTYGNRDGLLRDESVVVSTEAICQMREACGFDVLDQPTVRAEATDCGGNTGSDEFGYRGRMTLLPGVCD